MTTIAIIPARGGSTRIPKKNIRPFHGKPIIAYSIETARASHLFDEIVVSTDDPAIIDVAKKCGAKVHMRRASLCRDQVGTQEVTRAVLKWWGEQHPERAGTIACCIYATAPLMTVADLRRGREMLEVSGYAYAYAVGGNDYPFEHAGTFYWGHAAAFLQGLKLGQCKTPAGSPDEAATVLVHIPANRVCDINTEDDWLRAEAMYQELQEQRIEQEASQ